MTAVVLELLPDPSARGNLAWVIAIPPVAFAIGAQFSPSTTVALLMGLAGVLVVLAVNPRFKMLAASALALLGAALALTRQAKGWARRATVTLTTAGHVAMLTLLLTEAATVVGTADELLMLSTLILGVYAAGLLGLGFCARNQLHRLLGLGLLAVTLLKLALFDVWSLDRIYQMLVLVGVGSLLVAAGFLYARFGRRLVALLRDVEP